MDTRSLAVPSVRRLVLYVQYERDFLRTSHKRKSKFEPSETFPLLQYLQLEPSSIAISVSTTCPA